MELSMIWQILHRRKWIIIQALLIIFLVAFISSYLIAPTYQASSKIVIKSIKKADIDKGSFGLLPLSSIIATTSSIDINKILAISKPVINRMVVNLQIRNKDGNLIPATSITRTGVVSGIKRKISPAPYITIDQFQNTDILQITASSPDAEEAMMMANTLAQTMVNENQMQMRAEYRSARVFLVDQIEQVKEQYNETLRNLMDFRKKEKTLDLAMETKLATEKMAELLKQKEDNIIDLAETNAKLKRMKEQLDKQGSEFLTASSIKENPQMEILKERLTDLKIQLSEATSELTDKHPKVLSLREQIKTVESEIRREIEIYKSSAPELIALERQIAALEAHLKGVNSDINRYFSTLGNLPEKAYNQANIDMEINVTERVYGNLMDALHQVGIAEATTLSEIRVVDPAAIPMAPVSPNKRTNAIFGVLFGLLFGIGLAFLYDYIDDRITTPEDLKEFKPFVLIGSIPLIQKKRSPLISSYDTNDPFFESYRTIQTYLKFAGKEPLKRVLITSAGPGEGKTTTVVNLGISITHEGKTVILVDMDLRRPQIHNYLKLSNKIGATDILQGKASIDDATQRTRIRGLNVITSGPSSSDPNALIESAQMGKFMSDLANRYDVIIIDSAPLLVKNDALVLSRFTDSSIIVLESRKTTRRGISSVIDILTKANIKSLGFVLNKLSIKHGKHY